MTFTNHIQTMKRLSKRLVTLPALEHLQFDKKVGKSMKKA